MGVNVNELFGGAAMKAFTDLDWPEDNRPSQINSFIAVSTHDDQIAPSDFQPYNGLTGFKVAMKPTSDL